MRFFQTHRARRLWLLTAILAIVIGSFSVYLVTTTRDPISYANFRKLHENMHRDMVKKILGDVPANPPSRKIGDWVLPLFIDNSNSIGKTIVERHTWEGSEGQICVDFDREQRLIGAYFSQRVTWRYKLEQWLGLSEARIQGANAPRKS